MFSTGGATGCSLSFAIAIQQVWRLWCNGYSVGGEALISIKI
jgi:hypothetical protein